MQTFNVTILFHERRGAGKKKKGIIEKIPHTSHAEKPRE
jgi:hypothetical protein